MNSNANFEVSGGAGTFADTAIAFDGTDMWITNFNADQITILNASDGSFVETLTTSDGVGDNPTYLSFDGCNMWVSNENDNNVGIFRVSDFTHLADISVGTAPNRIAFDSANTWISANDGRIFKR